jgi:hypothetical protein
MSMISHWVHAAPADTPDDDLHVTRREPETLEGQHIYTHGMAVGGYGEHRHHHLGESIGQRNQFSHREKWTEHQRCRLRKELGRKKSIHSVVKGKLGMPVSTVTGWIEGIANPPVGTWQKLCKHLGMEP